MTHSLAPNRARLTAVARAVALATTLTASLTSVQAGPGFADITQQNGSAGRIQTFFAYSPWGVRTTPTTEAEDTARFPNLTGNPDSTGKALRKFIDPLPRPGIAKAQTMADGSTSKYLPMAVPTKWISPNSGAATGDDYYEIGLVEYADRFHSDLRKATVLRGYVQIDHLASNGRGSVPGSKALFLYYPNSSGKVAFANAGMDQAPTDAKPIMIQATDAKGFVIAGSMVQAQVVDAPHFLGPVIASNKDIPTRMKFLNLLPAGRAEIDPALTEVKNTMDVSGNPVQFNQYHVTDRHGDLMFPVDKSLLGAGVGPDGLTEYTQNRAQIHLHGGDTPWISDGTPHQWITPLAETDASLKTADGKPLTLAGKFADTSLGLDPAYLPEYLRGQAAANVPDMPNPGAGAVTYYYPNGQTARMLWYHDHSLASTRLNVYAGMASAYFVTDSTEQALIAAGTLPDADHTLPLVLQDRTFVPDDIALQDERWNTTAWGAPGDSWFPHVYETVQDPNQINSWNAVGRWHYGPWFWPVFPSLYPLPLGVYSPEGAENTATTTPEAWMDTPIVNGVAYPVTEVDPTTYRFRILNASNDRMMTVNFFKSKDTATLSDGTSVSNTEVLDSNNVAIPSEVDMVPAAISSNTCAPGVMRPQAVNGVYCQPDFWPTDNRDGGMPAPSAVGPAIYQIGTEGGFLPKPVQIEPSPITYLQDKGRVNVLNVNTKSLFLAPAERADILVDFSAYAGQTLIMYNDSGAPIPASDPRNETFTGYADQSGGGGAETTKPGYGPNSRTMMLVRVKAAMPAGVAANVLNPVALNTAISNAYVATQDRPVVAQPAYAALDTTGTWANIAPVATTPGQASAYASIYTATLKQPTFDFIPGRPDAAINGVDVTAQGAGYITAPVVTITKPAAASGVAATAKATMKIDKINVTAAGSGYTTAPLFTITGGGGNGATGTARLGINTVKITNGGSGYTAAPTVAFSAPQVVGGTKPVGKAVVAAGKVTGITITTPGVGYTAAPLVSLTGGGGVGAKATTSGYVSSVAVDVLDPLNPGTAGGGGYVDLNPNSTNPAITPITYTFTGGNGTGAAAVATGKVFNITLTSPGSGYVATDKPTVTMTAPPTGGTLALATANSSQSSYLVKNKGIQELFDPTYGRLNATFSVELPFTSSTTQTTIPMAYVDEPTEKFSDNETQIWKITHNGVDSHPVHFHLLNVQVINRVGWDGYIMPPEANELGWKETVRMNPLEDIIVAVKAKRPTLNGFGLPASIRSLDPSQPIGSPFGFSQIDPTTGMPKVVTNAYYNYGWEYVWHCHILGHEENDFMRPWAFDAKDLLSNAPSGVAAAAASGNATVTWTDPTPYVTVTSTVHAALNPSDEVGFRVERALAGSNAWQAVATGLTAIPGLIQPGSGLPGTPALVNTLANATSYADSTPVVVPAPTAPGKPAVGTVGTTSAALSWTASTGASSYNVQRATVTNGVVGSYSQVGTTAARSYTDSTLSAGQSYSYTVQAVSGSGGTTPVTYRVVSVNTIGESASAASASVNVASTGGGATDSVASNQVNTLPAAPTFTGTGVTVNSTTSATVNWIAGAGAATYQVSYCSSTTAGGTCTMGNWNAVPTGTSFTVTGLTAGRYVQFAVQGLSAANVASTSALSGKVQMVLPPVAPTGVTARNGTAGGVVQAGLNFGNVTGATSYNIRWSTDSQMGGTVTQITGATSGSQYTLAGVTAGIAVNAYMQVQAVNGAGGGAWSTIVGVIAR